jgi:hypothetical protein
MQFKREKTMLDILRETEKRFQEIQNLLNNNSIRNRDYFAQLSERTQAAYVTMNEGMCENTTVCQQCAEHRDFLYAMLGILEDLESGSPISDAHEKKLNVYKTKVTEILAKISAVLVSL